MENNENIEVNAEKTDKKGKNPNKITPLEIFILALIVICITLYISPNILVSAENRKNAQIQTNAGILTSKILNEFSDNTKKEKKASKVAQKLADELNQVNKNPCSKKEKAYSINEKCTGCVTIIPDDKLNSITVEGYTTDNILLVRTVIQPPSFVTYTKDLDSLKEDAKKPKDEKKKNGK